MSIVEMTADFSYPGIRAARQVFAADIGLHRTLVLMYNPTLSF